MNRSRRRFLLHSTGALLALGLAPLAHSAPQRRTLVLLELQGGHDSLNAFIPRSQIYERLRPTLAIPRDARLQLDDGLALNPALEPLMPVWQAGELALVQGLGYPRPNRSHFRSIEIWDTGASGGQYLDSGWLARGLPETLRGRYLSDGIVLGRNPAPLSGAGSKPLVMQRLDVFLKRAARFDAEGRAAGNPALAHLLAVEGGVERVRRGLAQRLQELSFDGKEFPKSRIGQGLREAARLILMGDAAPVIKVSHGSFDTHANQRARHDRLLGQLAEALAAFRNTLRAQGAWDRVLLMTYSEFGRRVAENGSRGTDHGQAATHLVMGGRVRGGRYGEFPDLRHLSDGDLAFTTDFRRLYNSVLVEWFGVAPLYSQKEQPGLGLVRG